MGKIFKIFAAVVGVLVIGIVGLLATALFIDWGRFTGYAETVTSGALGRDVEIGSLSASVGWTTRVTLRDLRIANPSGIEGDFAKVDMLTMTFKPWSFVMGDRIISEILLDKPVIAAIEEKGGKTTWDFAPQGEVAAEAATPDDRTEFPVIKRLVVRDGRAIYWDMPRGLKLDGTISTVFGEGDGNAGVALELKGKLEEFAVQLEFSGDALERLRAPEVPYRFNLRVEVGATKVRAKGTAMEPVQLRGFDMDFSLSGPTLAHVFPIFLIPMPATPPYTLQGRLARIGEAWSLSDFTGRIADSDMRGSVTVDYTRKRPSLRGELVSANLDLSDLGGLIGVGKKDAAEKSEEKDAKSARSGILPDTPIDTARFRAADLDLRFRGEKISGPGIPDMSLDMRVILKDGVLHADPLKLDLPEGRFEGNVALDANRKPPTGEASLFVRDVGLKSLFGESRFAPLTSGTLKGELKLQGAGASFAGLLGKSNGTVALTTSQGTLSGLLVEAAGLDIMHSLALVIGGDRSVPMRCGRIDGDMQDGMFRLRRAIIDTTASVLVAGGAVDLSKEELAIQAQGFPKEFSLVDLAAPIFVRGPFSDPSVRVGIDPLPFFESGDTRDVDCGALLQ